MQRRPGKIPEANQQCFQVLGVWEFLEEKPHLCYGAVGGITSAGPAVSLWPTPLLSQTPHGVTCSFIHPKLPPILGDEGASGAVLLFPRDEL